jgi:hypothetical protein
MYKTHWKCPTCGATREPEHFTRAGLNLQRPQAMVQIFRGYTPGGGGIEWRRRPLDEAELERLGLVLGRTIAIWEDATGRGLRADPDELMLEALDDDELEQLGQEWEMEALRRAELVQQERNRRLMGG